VRRWSPVRCVTRNAPWCERALADPTPLPGTPLGPQPTTRSTPSVTSSAISIRRPASAGPGVPPARHGTANPMLIGASPRSADARSGRRVGYRSHRRSSMDCCSILKATRTPLHLLWVRTREDQSGHDEVLPTGRQSPRPCPFRPCQDWRPEARSVRRCRMERQARRLSK
jgi:hypothetical protein